MNNKSGLVIEGLDIVDVLSFIEKKNKRFVAIALKEIEEIVGKDSPKYPELRKLFLDTFNNYTRSILRTIFGDIEGQSDGKKDTK